MSLIKKTILPVFAIVVMFTSCYKPVINGGENGEGYKPTVVSEGLTAPSNLQVTKGELGYVKVSWQRNAEADGYYVYASFKSDSGFEKVSDLVKDTKWFDKDTFSGDKFYKVVSVKLFKNETLYRQSPGSVVKPGNMKNTVSSLAATSRIWTNYALDDQNIYSGLELFWEPVAGADYYRVQRAVNASGSPEGEFAFVNYASGEPLIVTEPYLKDLNAPKGEYLYRVVACKFATNGQESIIGAESDFCVVENYCAVSSLKAVRDSNSVSLSWTTEFPGGTFRVMKSVNEGPFKFLAMQIDSTVIDNETVFSCLDNDGINAEDTYSYYVDVLYNMPLYDSTGKYFPNISVWFRISSPLVVGVEE
jgi:hypothetical protein